MSNLYKEHFDQHLTPLTVYSIMAQAGITPLYYKPFVHLSELAQNVNLPLPDRINSPIKYKIFIDTTSKGISFHHFLHHFLRGLEKVPDTARFMLVANLMCKQLRNRHRQKRSTFAKVCTYFRQTLNFINIVVARDIEDD